MAGARVYNLMYWAGLARLFWSRVDRPEIRALVEGGPCGPERLAPPGGGRPRAIDLGCGEGGVSMYLARRGFEVTGVDFSAVALSMARRAASRAGLDGGRLRFVKGDLTAPAIPALEGPFDLLVDYGTLDDLTVDGRRRAARLITSLARPGSRFFLYAFEARRASLPWFSLRSPSRFAPEVFEPGEVEALFGGSWDVERIPRDGPQWISNYLLTRKEGRATAAEQCMCGGGLERGARRLGSRRSSTGGASWVISGRCFPSRHPSSECGSSWPTTRGRQSGNRTSSR